MRDEERERMTQELRDLRDSIKRIEHAIAGSEMSPESGIAHRLKALEEYRMSDEAFKHKAVGALGILSFLFSIIGSSISKMFH
jgi:5-carboxymethyl-2-hydroxymuconate isomerase